MYTKFSALLLCSLSAALAQQATVDGTFTFTSPQPHIQEAATILRAVLDLPQVNVDPTQPTLTFKGSASQVATAQWTLGELDRPGGETAVHEYTLPSGEIVRVNFVTNVTTPQGMQELLTVLRTVADTQHIFNLTSRGAVVIRAKPIDIAFCEWIIDQVNQPARQVEDPSPQSYSGTTTLGYPARANVVTAAKSPRDLQERLTVLRAVADVQKIFNYSARHMLILQAPQPTVDLAEWLLAQLNQPGTGTQTYTAPAADDVTRIFFFSNATPQGIQSALTAIRTDTKIRKAFWTSSPAALVVRGTTDQVEAAAQLVAARNGMASLYPR